MANLYLDTNVFIDIAERKTEEAVQWSDGKKLFISILSIHIISYIYHYRMPHDKLLTLLENINLIPFTVSVSKMALEGPTKDYEDNVQLHSAVEANCDKFMTRDKKLLKLRYFGKMKIENYE